MTLRLAGAGTTIGLSEPDILGMATALSSLGIEAESGGSSLSKLMVELQLATAQGGDYLQQFADVAGTSAEEFTTAFQNDPISAITMFVEGLGKVDAAGGSSIETLDLMGISEIRMRDALLRLANGSDILSTAVQTSNTAWEQNTALQVEADKRYATTESQLLLLKNKLMEVAISAGEELLPALNNIIDSLDPMIESLSDGVKWFANLDDSTKEATLKLAGFVIMGAPVLKGVAGITKALGSSVKGFGKLSLGIGETIIAGTKATTSTGALTTSLAGMTTGASASTGGLGALFAGLTTTVGGVVILTGAIAGISAVLLKMKDDYDLSKKQTELWGDGISEETADALDSFKTFNMEANNELDNFNSGITDSTDGVISAYDNMIESLKGQAEDAKATVTESFDYLPEELQEKFQESVNRRVLNIDNLILQAEEAEAKITEILRTAESERRALTEDEQARIEALQTQIANVQAELAAENAEQQKKILGNLNTDIENLNKDQLQSHYDMLTEKRKAENEDYDKSIAALNEYRDQISDTKYLEYLDEINDAHDESNKDLVASQAAALAEMGASQETIDLLLSESGMTYAEAMERYAGMTENSTKGMIENTEGMTEVMKEANRTWNSMIFNPITGEVNSNIAEVVNVAVESESSWNELKFALQHADMDSNTKEQIKQALIDNGKWNELTFAEQQAIMTTTAKDAAQEFMEASGKWDELSPEEKKLWMDTNSNETMIEFLESHGQWDALSPELKKYVTETNAELTEVEFDGAYRAWQAMNPKEVAMNTTTNAWAVAEEVRRINAGIPDENVYIDVVTRRTYTATSPTGQQGMGYAKGTNFHKGGMAILGDGGRKEPYLTPDGRFGVSPAVDTMYNLPRGSKVWSSIQKFKAQASNNDYLKSFMGQLPRFATGTSSSFLDSPQMPNVFNEQKSNSVSSNDNYNIYLTVNGDLPDSTIRKMATRIEKEIKNINDRKTSSIGGAVRF